MPFGEIGVEELPLPVSNTFCSGSYARAPNGSRGYHFANLELRNYGFGVSMIGLVFARGVAVAIILAKRRRRNNGFNTNNSSTFILPNDSRCYYLGEKRFCFAVHAHNSSTFILSK